SKSPKRAKYDFSANATSPFPTCLALSLKDVQTVFRLLEDKHGKIEMSQSKPFLGLQIEGCNEEEPALINAIIRARLSAGTNDMNASRAFIGTLETFGRRKPGSAIGIVDWEAVRLAPVEDLYEAIKTGGMGNVKSRSVKAILDMVHDENVVQRKQGEIPVKADGIDLLTLEYMRSLSKDEAFEKFITFPGVGPKTAACVISICMQHSSFAVDTHVYWI
ncbi:DNA glycosylase, partial [Leptodontidium sp. 2 PMI_412]